MASELKEKSYLWLRNQVGFWEARFRSCQPESGFSYFTLPGTDLARYGLPYSCSGRTWHVGPVRGGGQTRNPSKLLKQT